MITARVVNGLWQLSGLPGERAFRRALHEPADHQANLLHELVRRNAQTDFGRRHRFDAIDSVRDFQRRVPLSRYDDYAEDIDAIRRGRGAVLTAEPVRRLVPSSGSTGARKLIPYTDMLSRQMSRALKSWICDLYRRYPNLKGGPAYWSVSPAWDLPDEPSAVPIGFEDDTAYLGQWLGPLVSRVLVATPALRRTRPLAAFQYATLVMLLLSPQLRLISVWHPSFLSMLLQQRVEVWERLLADIHQGTLRPPGGCDPSTRSMLEKSLRPDPERARELDTLGPEALPQDYWPALQLVSAWADAAASPAFAELRRDFPRATVQPKGLLSTEAFVTIPYRRGWPLAVDTHFFEFIDDQGDVHTANQLRMHDEYEVVVTTGGGLYRYRTGDRVRVDGYIDATPSVRFVGRTDQVVDLVGEKLHEAGVDSVLKRVLGAEHTGFAMLAPDPGEAGAGYTLYLDAVPREPEQLLARVTVGLRENPNFAYAQDLGQLGALGLYVVDEPAQAACLRRCEALGQTLGTIKPTALSRLGGWSDHFHGHYCKRAGPAHQSSEKGTALPVRDRA